jgi:hypothetical protein
MKLIDAWEMVFIWCTYDLGKRKEIHLPVKQSCVRVAHVKWLSYQPTAVTYKICNYLLFLRDVREINAYNANRVFPSIWLHVSCTELLDKFGGNWFL